ncbi:MAG: DEAD/DEAH box helicase [bacterium]
MDHALHAFHPLIARWFLEKYHTPTEIQEKAWEGISAGSHVLLTAPTGSGKTLAAFLWAINQLAAGCWPPGQIRVLYVSPLKALNNDIRLNLIHPLGELQGYFLRHGENFPRIHIRVRSGDTPQQERRSMLRHPPEILITTPESLNLLLSSKRARPLLTGIATVICDEIHAVADNKRGTHLITAVERLVPLSGEFQRIGLSATIRPIEKVADFIAGYAMETHEGEVLYRKRHVRIIRSDFRKQPEVRVSFPHDVQAPLTRETWWHRLIGEFVTIIRNNRSTLFFTNNRRLTEKITRLINEEQGELLAYSHHGSLSKELRRHVEQMLKRGELKAILATSSLELGIDIGALDEVVLIQAPLSISAAVQRIGRAGHAVKETSRARIYPLHGRDLVTGAVMAKAVMEGAIEAVRIPECPLDVLAQIVVSMAGTEQWDRDALFHHMRASYPFHHLARTQYDCVLEMLSGRYADSRIRELRPRISIDAIDNTIQGKQGALRLLYVAGGTIPDRGYYTMRLSENKAKIGELDEEFVWERRVGDTFTLGTQAWRIEGIDHQHVDVVPLTKPHGMAPFWRGESLLRGFHLSERIAVFLEEWNRRVEEADAHHRLSSECHMDEEAAAHLIDVLKGQKRAAGPDLPHRHLLLVECCTDFVHRDDTGQVILHTLWGSRLNLPFFIALAQAWEETYHLPLHGFQENDCILLNLPHRFSPHELFDLVTPENIHALLRKRLEKTGFFGARFRENAGRALLLPKQGFHTRVPLWLTRLRSKRILHAVSRYEDFPILAETWRECLQDAFDLDNLIRMLDEIRDGRIEVREVRTKAPSPFAADVIWQQANTLVYEDDTPAEAKASRLKGDIIEDLIFTPGLRPQVSPEILDEFIAKIQGTHPGYAPATPPELLDLLKERILIPEPEWNRLIEPIHSHVESVKDKICIRVLSGATIPVVIAMERLPRIEKALLGDEEILLPLFAEWMQFYGPISQNFIRMVWGVNEEVLNNLSESLVNQRTIVSGHISEKAQELEWCDARNLEMLLRMTRKKGRPAFEALDLSYLPLLVAHVQGLVSPGGSKEDLQNCLETLWGYPAMANLWETEIFPARLVPYQPSWLDTLFLESELVWFGCGRERVGFCFEGDLDLFVQQPRHEDRLNLFPEQSGKYSFWDLSRESGIPSDVLTERLWETAWDGLVSNDRIQVLRAGIENGFRATGLPPLSRGRARGIRSHFDRWKSSRPDAGNWFILKRNDLSEDPLEKEEMVRDRIRILLQRYGILFREILGRELKELQWPSIFRSLRMMELSGEILAGYFFTGIPGMQFISHYAFREIRKGLPEDAIYWMNAADPASLCGVPMEGLKRELPARIPSTHLVFHGRRIVLVSRQRGRRLEFRIPPEDPYVSDYCKLFQVRLTRRFSPLKRIKVDTINAKPAVESPYQEALTASGFRRDFKSLVLW